MFKCNILSPLLLTIFTPIFRLIFMETRAIKIDRKHHQKLKELAIASGKTITEIANEIFEKHFSQETENYMKQTTDLLHTILGRIQNIEREVLETRMTAEATNSIVKTNARPQPTTNTETNKILDAFYEFFKTHAYLFYVVDTKRNEALKAYKDTIERIKKSV